MASIKINFYSKTLLKNAVVNVFLPSNDPDGFLFGGKDAICEEKPCYKVLYLLHGSYGDANDWPRLSNVERYANTHKNLVVVMPSAENSSYVDMYRGENYLRYIGEELPQFIATLLPSTSAKREDTFIAGLSMGGYGAMRVALEYPDRFSHVASLSGALDVHGLQNSTGPHNTKLAPGYKRAVFKDRVHLAGSKDDLFAILPKLVESKANLPSMFLSCGTEDFLLDGSEKFYETATGLGLAPEYQKHPGVHDWLYWDTHIQDVLNWLPIQQ